MAVGSLVALELIAVIQWLSIMSESEQLPTTGCGLPVLCSVALSLRARVSAPSEVRGIITHGLRSASVLCTAGYVVAICAGCRGSRQGGCGWFSSSAPTHNPPRKKAVLCICTLFAASAVCCCHCQCRMTGTAARDT
jgi:hypothetical protein